MSAELLTDNMIIALHWHMLLLRSSLVVALAVCMLPRHCSLLAKRCLVLRSNERVALTFGYIAIKLDLRHLMQDQKTEE